MNQTLYFLRRDVDPWYDEDSSAEYVHFRKELLWLDSDLVKAASVEFEQSLAPAMSTIQTTPEIALGILESYTGRFAPEFEYEEWAIGWRDRLQAMYLHAVQAATRELVTRGSWTRAIAVVQQALAVAPDTTDLDRWLVWLYSAANAPAAAAEQYRHYVGTYREEYGEEPPSFEKVRSDGL